MWYGIQMSSQQQVTFVHYQPRSGAGKTFRLTQHTKLSPNGPFSLFANKCISSKLFQLGVMMTTIQHAVPFRNSSSTPYVAGLSNL